MTGAPVQEVSREKGGLWTALLCFMTLFGAVCDTIVQKAPCSVLAVRRHQSATAAWLHHQARRLWKN